MSPGFDKVLVANRGEIAVRVIRGCRQMGYKTVAVHSEADESLCIGPARAKDSYLSMARILEAARQSGAQAIHPGYGFLSERAEFAQAVLDAGLVFIGPDPESIAAMGNKSAAKQRMLAAGVPCIRGYQGAEQSTDSLGQEARAIGMPVMIKAAHGGGGRGMRLVSDESQLAAAIESARGEATSAFGSGELLIERAVVDARHVEIQVFGDRHGNVIHIGERDCSIQRRNQKIVEESPSPAVDDDLRARMGAAAVAAARAVRYVGAGTVEFMLAPDGRFYFLEMNTRLQVEHPVTEMVYGIDLVEWQLRVARGEPLPLTQEEVLARRRGWAIEVRLCAEDPAKGFMPHAGTVLAWRAPGGIRFDHGLGAAHCVSPFYDSMLGKLIAHGADREEARLRLLQALDDTLLHGVASNRGFLMKVLEHRAFSTGQFSTRFIDRHFPAAAIKAACAAGPLHAAVAAVMAHTATGRADAVGETAMRLQCGEQEFACRVAVASGHRFDVIVRTGEAEHPQSLEVIPTGEGEFLVQAGSVRGRAFATCTASSIWLSWDRSTLLFRRDPP